MRKLRIKLGETRIYLENFRVIRNNLNLRIEIFLYRKLGDSFVSFVSGNWERGDLLDFPGTASSSLSPFALSPSFFTPLSFAPLRSGSEEFAGIIPSEKMFKCTALLRCLLPPFCSPRSQLFNSGSTHTAQYSDHCNNNSTNNADLHTREICRFFVVHPIYIYIYDSSMCIDIFLHRVYWYCLWTKYSKGFYWE